jgi:hypothetical protein
VLRRSPTREKSVLALFLQLNTTRAASKPAKGVSTVPSVLIVSQNKLTSPLLNSSSSLISSSSNLAKSRIPGLFNGGLAFETLLELLE